MEEPVLFTPFDYFCAGKALHNCGGQKHVEQMVHGPRQRSLDARIIVVQTMGKAHTVTATYPCHAL